MTHKRNIPNLKTSIDSPQPKQQKKTILIFDIDGVLTNPDTKVPHPALLRLIADHLRGGIPVALATGRAFAWVNRTVLTPVQEHLEDYPQAMERLFVSSEKGAITVTFEKGSIHKEAVSGVALSEDVLDKLQSLVTYDKGVFIDPEKERMFSVEIEGGDKAEEVRRQKEVLLALQNKIEDVLIDYPHLEVEVTEIALDVQRRGVNKRIASSEFVKFLEKGQREGKNNSPHTYVFAVFGDSPSDLFISEELYDRGFDTWFGFVGRKPIADFSYPFEIIRPPESQLFEQGTLSLLRKKSLLV